jgi:hypothetical protein
MQTRPENRVVCVGGGARMVRSARREAAAAKRFMRAEIPENPVYPGLRRWRPKVRW